MGQITTITDKETGEVYTISTVKNNKKVSANNKSFRTVYETALLMGKSPHTKTSKPLCVFELINFPESDMSLEDFHNKLLRLVEDHSLNELLNDSSTSIYLEEGFYCHMTNSFKVFTLSKVKLFYLFPLQAEYSKHNQTGEEYYNIEPDTKISSNTIGQIPTSQSLYKDSVLGGALALKYEEIISACITF